jgi:hypothetical protein
VLPPAVQCVPRQAWRNVSALLGERTLAEEVPAAFSYDGMAHAVLMATPDDLEDFGWASVTPKELSQRRPKPMCSRRAAALVAVLRFSQRSG